jgi:hypothetical protein
VYCQSGIQAAYDYFTLELTGFRPVEQFANLRRLFESSERWLFLPPHGRKPVRGDPVEKKAT